MKQPVDPGKIIDILYLGNNPLFKEVTNTTQLNLLNEIITALAAVPNFTANVLSGAQEELPEYSTQNTTSYLTHGLADYSELIAAHENLESNPVDTLPDNSLTTEITPSLENNDLPNYQQLVQEIANPALNPMPSTHLIPTSSPDKLYTLITQMPSTMLIEFATHLVAHQQIILEPISYFIARLPTKDKKSSIAALKKYLELIHDLIRNNVLTLDYLDKKNVFSYILTIIEQVGFDSKSPLSASVKNILLALQPQLALASGYREFTTSSLLKDILQSNLISAQAKSQFSLFLIENNLQKNNLQHVILENFDKIDPAVLFKKTKNAPDNILITLNLIHSIAQVFYGFRKNEHPFYALGMTLKHVRDAAISVEDKVLILKRIDSYGLQIIGASTIDSDNRKAESISLIYMQILDQVLNDSMDMSTFMSFISILGRNNTARSPINLTNIRERHAYITMLGKCMHTFANSSFNPNLIKLVIYSFYYRGDPNNQKKNLIGTLCEAKDHQNLSGLLKLVTLYTQHKTFAEDAASDLITELLTHGKSIFVNTPAAIPSLFDFFKIYTANYDRIQNNWNFMKVFILNAIKVISAADKYINTESAINNLLTLYSAGLSKGMLNASDITTALCNSTQNDSDLIYGLLLKKQPNLIKNILLLVNVSDENQSLDQYLDASLNATSSLNSQQKSELLWQFTQAGLSNQVSMALHTYRHKINKEYIFNKIAALPLAERNQAITTINESPWKNLFFGGKTAAKWTSKFAVELKKPERQDARNRNIPATEESHPLHIAASISSQPEVLNAAIPLADTTPTPEYTEAFLTSDPTQIDQQLNRIIHAYRAYPSDEDRVIRAEFQTS